MNIKKERLAGSNLDGSAKIPPCSTKKMTEAEIAELMKVLDASFKGVKPGTVAYWMPLKGVK